MRYTPGRSGSFLRVASSSGVTPPMLGQVASRRGYFFPLLVLAGFSVGAGLSGLAGFPACRLVWLGGRGRGRLGRRGRCAAPRSGPEPAWPWGPAWRSGVGLGGRRRRGGLRVAVLDRLRSAKLELERSGCEAVDRRRDRVAGPDEHAGVERRVPSAAAGAQRDEHGASPPHGVTVRLASPTRPGHTVDEQLDLHLDVATAVGHERGTGSVDRLTPGRAGGVRGHVGDRRAERALGRVAAGVGGGAGDGGRARTDVACRWPAGRPTVGAASATSVADGAV